MSGGASPEGREGAPAPDEELISVEEAALIARRNAFIRVQISSMGLVFVGASGFLTYLFVWLMPAGMLGFMERIAPDRPQPLEAEGEREPGAEPESAETGEAEEAGETIAPAEEPPPQPVRPPLWQLLGFLLGTGLTVWGGLEMRRLGNRRAAFLGAILAMTIPPCCCMGFLFGPWAITTLLREDVAEQFLRR